MGLELKFHKGMASTQDKLRTDSGEKPFKYKQREALQGPYYCCEVKTEILVFIVARVSLLQL